MVLRNYFLIIVVSLLFGDAGASDCMVIDKIPASITKPGCYLLNSDWVLTEPNVDGIVIKANDVRIDLNGHVIKGFKSPSSTSNGIYGDSIKNIIIENGTIDGFFYGIRLDGKYGGGRHSGIYIKGVNVIDSYFRGIMVESSGVKLFGNNILRTGFTEIGRAHV